MNKLNKSPMESTLKNPLKFFKYFYQNGGFQRFQLGFFDLEVNQDFYGPDLFELNKDEGFIKYLYRDDDNNKSERTVYFLDSLKSTLDNERQKSCDFIKQQIMQLSRKGKSFNYLLDAILVELTELKNAVKYSKIFTFNEFNIESIYKIVLYLEYNYPSFFEKNKMPLVREALLYKQQRKRQVIKSGLSSTKDGSKSTSKIIAFKWRNLDQLKTIVLYDILKNIAVEDDSETLDKFVKAFSGKPLEDPLKIKWKLTKNSKYPKPSLIRMFHLLMHEIQVIVPISGNKLFADTLQFIFVDKDGNQIRNVLNVMNEVQKTENLTMNERQLHLEIKNAFKTDNTAR